MPQQELIKANDGQSGRVTLPKGDLRRDGLVDEDEGEVKKTLVNIDRTGEREFRVKLVDPEKMREVA